MNRQWQRSPLPTRRYIKHRIPFRIFNLFKVRAVNICHRCSPKIRIISRIALSMNKAENGIRPNSNPSGKPSLSPSRHLDQTRSKSQSKGGTSLLMNLQFQWPLRTSRQGNQISNRRRFHRDLVVNKRSGPNARPSILAQGLYTTQQPRCESVTAPRTVGWAVLWSQHPSSSTKIERAGLGRIWL